MPSCYDKFCKNLDTKIDEMSILESNEYDSMGLKLFLRTYIKALIKIKIMHQARNLLNHEEFLQLVKDSSEMNYL